jgi:pyrroline-5-carboxylate reductase
VRAATSNTDLVRNADVIFVAVKPQYARTVLAEVASVLTPQHVVVSIAAGVTLQTLQVRFK